MQGKLRSESVVVEIETTCRHCETSLHIILDSDMQVSVHEKDAEPLVFMPDINWDNFSELTIIDAY